MTRRAAWLLMLLLCTAAAAAGLPAYAAGPVAGASAPPSTPLLHPFRECHDYCDSSYGNVETTTPLLSAVSTDPDTPSLTYTFTLEDWMTDELLASQELVAPQGEEVEWRVPAGAITGGTTYRWSVAVHDDATTVSDDRYFFYRERDGLLTRLLRPLEEPGFAVLLALPEVGAAMALLGLLLLPWRRHRRVGLWLLLGGLAVATVAVLILFEMLSQIGS